MKEQGIYTIISPYWGSAPRTSRRAGACPTPPPATPREGLLFDKTLQTGYKAWLKASMTAQPLHQVRLADDPAVAIIQLAE